MLRLFFTQRWLGLFALVVAVAVGCVLLSQWQWHRREQRVATNALVQTNYHKAAVPLDAAIGDGPLPTALTWTPVRVSGRYLTAGTVLIRNRPLNGEGGYYVVVPLRQDDGRVLFVNRGWVPAGSTGQAPDEVPAAPDGEVTVVARLLPAESPGTQDAPPGQAYRIAPARLASPADGAAVVTGAFGQLDAETPSSADAPTPLPQPELDEGPHLSYSVQWIMFGVGAFVGFYFLVRRALEDERAEREKSGSIPPRRPSRRPRRQPTDAEEEDAVLDAAQHRT